MKKETTSSALEGLAADPDTEFFSQLLYRIGINKVLKAHRVARERMCPTFVESEIGLLLGGKITVRVIFDGVS